MLRRIVRSSIFDRIKNSPIFSTKSVPIGRNTLPLLLSLTCYNNVDDSIEVKKAQRKCELLESEIVEKAYSGDPIPQVIELMEILEECILDVSTQYRSCIQKQIDILRKVSEANYFIDLMDQLPEHRCTANNLHDELTNYITLLRTVGEMTYENLASALNNGSFNNLECISRKYKDLETVLQTQLAENRKCEYELNTMTRNLILNFKI